jgi:hypothetical protein
MITIPVTVTGDHWLNVEQVRISLLASDPRECLVLDICAEGPSLWRLGVVDTVLAHCEQSQRDPQTVYISRWSNPVESVPFQRAGRADISHFYWGSDRYWPTGCIPCDHGHLWGFFMGRPTIPRLLLMQCLHNAGDVLLSCMQGGKIPNADQGIDVDSQEFGRCPDLASWYDTCGIASLDGAGIRDQYRSDHNTNLALMAWYDQFHIEIVAESYIYGDTFFPTEKTVRPISAGKPMIVMGPRHFLRRLRAQGFRTWSDIWDESYDDLEGIARLNQIKTVLADIAQRRDSILPHLAAHAQHNRQNLQDIIQRHRPGPY